MLESLLLAGSAGVGVQSNPMCVTAPPGSTAPAGKLYVTDTGTEGETIAVGTFPVGGTGQPLSAGQRQMPGSWVHVTYPRKWWVIPQSSASLAPGGSVYLPVSVTIPAGTPRGMYVVNIWAHSTAPGAPASGVSASAGAGAATVLIAGVGEPARCATPDPAQSVPAEQFEPAAATAPAKQRTPYIGWAILIVLAYLAVVAVSKLLGRS